MKKPVAAKPTAAPTISTVRALDRAELETIRGGHNNPIYSSGSHSTAGTNPLYRV